MAGQHGLTVDMHAHVFTPSCQKLVEGLMAPEMEPFSYWAGKETNEYQGKHTAEILPKLTDVSVRLRDMDAMGIDIQAISVAPPQFFYWADPELGATLARMVNENLAEIVSAHPDRFVGLATVPMQDVSRAVAELEHCVRDLGFRGVEINTNIAGRDLDDPRFRPFFAKAQELDVAVLLHPNGFTHGERFQKYYMTNVMGNPLDTSIALFRIIHGGVLEQFPDLKLCLVHGGGFLPFYSSRMDHAYEGRPEGRHHITRPPSTYLKQIYVDCLVFDEVHLEFLLQKMGADHVFIGTDYPFDMGYYDPLGQIGKVAGLTDEQRRQLHSGTASRLLGLDV
jgi:aminocarboxymuconate-semialdehyde decarboxylase